MVDGTKPDLVRSRPAKIRDRLFPDLEIDPALLRDADFVIAVCIPDDTVALLEDAYACFERRLLRPAVMLLGVAFERAVEEVSDAIVASNLISGPVPARSSMSGKRSFRDRCTVSRQ